MGALGRSFETGLLLLSDDAKFFVTLAVLRAATGFAIGLLFNGGLNGVRTTAALTIAGALGVSLVVTDG